MKNILTLLTILLIALMSVAIVSADVLPEKVCTGTQGAYGAPPAGENKAAFLVDHFADIGGSITIGGPNTATWDDPAAIEIYLPAGGPPGLLALGAVLNPAFTPSGVLDGQTLALALTLAFGNAGLIPDIGPLVLGAAFGGCAGITVDDLLGITDDVTGGFTPVAATCAVTLPTLTSYLDMVNNAGEPSNFFTIECQDCNKDLFDNCPKPFGAINACKYYDFDFNGVRNGEPPLPGFDFTVYDMNGFPVAGPFFTGGDGCVLFENLTPGTYMVKETSTPPGIWFNSDPNEDPCDETTPTEQVIVAPSQTALAEFGNFEAAEKHGKKFYDANANGLDDDGQVVANWQININGFDEACNAPFFDTTFTDFFGNYEFTGLTPGTYSVTETLPNAQWIQTAPLGGSYNIVLGPGDVDTGNDFGNACLGAGGGRTLGFWSNKNGQAQINDGGTSVPEFAQLTGLNLVDAAGNPVIFGPYSQFRTWILSATAVNMAYMLSAQLAAMDLNVEAVFVSGAALVYAPGLLPFAPIPGLNGLGFISIADLMTAANAALGADGYTPSGDENRAYQEALKNVLDAANNNLNFVQPTPCPLAPPSLLTGAAVASAPLVGPIVTADSGPSSTLLIAAVLAIVGLLAAVFVGSKD